MCIRDSYDTEESKQRSLGVLNILTLVEIAQARGLDYVYLGYWLGDSRKMSYKMRFQPSEIWSPAVGFVPSAGPSSSGPVIDPHVDL